MNDALRIGHMVLDFLDAYPWILITLIAHGAILGAVAYLILLERKIASWVQDRIGPNRTNLGFGLIPFMKDWKMGGLGQPLADGLKFILKEDYQPAGVDKILFTAAPMMMIIVVIMSIAVLPWGGIKQSSRSFDLASWVGNEEPADVRAALAPNPSATERDALDAKIREHLPSDAVGIDPKVKLSDGTIAITHADHVEDLQDADGIWRHHLISNVTYRYNFQSASLNVGVLFVLGTLSLAVYGVVIGGWASNNKYSFLGGLRATANMISYEIPLGLAILCVVIIFGTLNLEDIVNKQAHYWWGFIPAWNIFSQPMAFTLFLICIHAEANRAPFDTAECEQELVGGYHTEYSAMRFALFFLGEYAGMITTSVVCVALFFGGWHFPFADTITCWIVNLFAGLFHIPMSSPASASVDPNNPAVTNSLIVCIVRSLIIFGKTLVVMAVFMWVRWSLPRFRFDQIMNLAWRALIPISLALLMVTTLVVYFFGGAAGTDQFMPISTAFVMLIANVALAIGLAFASKLIPAGPDTNRKIRIRGSRFVNTPLPGGLVSASRN